ncbi:MAG TPA: 2-amino-4-hydroxy-6-hydroxymethyldihydropteridine diphosphokinase [Candidatus Saccharimonadales bacterium]|nr:2-amino-4-hydroxy-6-hydroxymethyldihydropteridine diphosphokinase [Candidatus Saccharimonadales bacterium]
MHKIVLALGSNVGERKENIMFAIDMLKEHIADIISGPLYETKPWGFTQQDNFYNTVIQGKTAVAPDELLVFLKKVEEKLGRVKRFMNGPREIDIDILLYDEAVLVYPQLIVPHPRMHERDFVLQPLCDIAPDTLHPIYKKTMAELLAALSADERSIIRKIQEV